MTSRNLSDGALGRQDGLVRDEPIISTEAEDGLSLDLDALHAAISDTLSTPGFIRGREKLAAFLKLIAAARTQAHAPAGGEPDYHTDDEWLDAEAQRYFRDPERQEAYAFGARDGLERARQEQRPTPPAHPEATAWTYEFVNFGAGPGGCDEVTECRSATKPKPSPSVRNVRAHPAPAVTEGEKVATAFHDGAMAALGCRPWEDASDFFILVGQDYAAGRALPQTMPTPVLSTSPPPGDQEEVLDPLAIRIASFPAHEDDLGPDNTVIGDHVPSDPGQPIGDIPGPIKRLAADLRTLLSASPSPPSGDREAVALVQLIDALRAEEGASVTLSCDNPDFEGPNNAVEASGSWTDWQERRFTGESLFAALTAANDARLKAETADALALTPPTSGGQN